MQMPSLGLTSFNMDGGQVRNLPYGLVSEHLKFFS